METPKIFESEYRFCLILWERSPVRSKELVDCCMEWFESPSNQSKKADTPRGVLWG